MLHLSCKGQPSSDCISLAIYFHLEFFLIRPSVNYMYNMMIKHIYFSYIFNNSYYDGKYKFNSSLSLVRSELISKCSGYCVHISYIYIITLLCAMHTSLFILPLVVLFLRPGPAVRLVVCLGVV